MVNFQPVSAGQSSNSTMTSNRSLPSGRGGRVGGGVTGAGVTGCFVGAGDVGMVGLGVAGATTCACVKQLNRSGGFMLSSQTCVCIQSYWAEIREYTAREKEQT